MQLNHLGPTQLINELAPALAGREDAFVAAITGVVAEKSFPGMSAYCASKSALSSWLAAVAVSLAALIGVGLPDPEETDTSD